MPGGVDRGIGGTLYTVQTRTEKFSSGGWGKGFRINFETISHD